MSELELTSILRRVRVEYDEMPGLVLTIPQAARLWRVEKSVVEHVMLSLVAADYSGRARSGSSVGPSPISKPGAGVEALGLLRRTPTTMPMSE